MSIQEIKTSTSVEVEYMKMEERERLVKEEATRASLRREYEKIVLRRWRIWNIVRNCMRNLAYKLKKEASMGEILWKLFKHVTEV